MKKVLWNSCKIRIINNEGKELKLTAELFVLSSRQVEPDR